MLGWWKRLSQIYNDNDNEFVQVWKARLAGYEEMIKIFVSLENEKSPEFSRYAGLMKKVVTDNNAVAQEKGMDLVTAFVENASTQIAAR